METDKLLNGTKLRQNKHMPQWLTLLYDRSTLSAIYHTSMLAGSIWSIWRYGPSIIDSVAQVNKWFFDICNLEDWYGNLSIDNQLLTNNITIGILSTVFLLIWYKVGRVIANGRTLTNDIIKNTDLSGKNIIVTGANSGLGFETAKQLYKWNANVIMACRNEKLANEALHRIKQDCSSYNVNGTITFKQLDLCDFSIIRNFAKDVNRTPIDILVNNAGIMMPLTYQKGPNGQELQLEGNHFGVFLLTYLLLDNIKKTNGKIVSLSSLAHSVFYEWKDRINFDEFDSQYQAKNYNAGVWYGLSKLCNLMMTRSIQKLLDQDQDTTATAYCCHPGIIFTNLDRYIAPSSPKVGQGISFMIIMMYIKDMCSSCWRYFVLGTMKWMASKDISAGAATQIYLCAQKKNKLIPGAYYAECVPYNPARTALWEEDCDRLWDLSCRFTKCQQ